MELPCLDIPRNQYCATVKTRANVCQLYNNLMGLYVLYYLFDCCIPVFAQLFKKV